MKQVCAEESYLTPTWGSRRAKNTQQFVVCHQLNISQCRFTEAQESMLLLVYNPYSTKAYHHVCLPANSLHYIIRDFNDEEVEYQLVPLVAAVINLPGRSSSAIQELCFEAENVPPLGYTAFYVSPVQDRLAENEITKKAAKRQDPEQDSSTPTIYNEFIKVTVSRDTGLLESISHVDGVKIDLSQNFYYYSQTTQSHQSGAYSFRTDKSRPTPVTNRVTYHSIKGVLVKEIRQRFTDWITQIIRLYRGEEFVEMEWIIGPVPIGTDLGKEVVTIFSTNITNNGQFYSDSNGRQMLRRTCINESGSELNAQQTKKPVPACYYPVTSRICIQSHNTSVAMCVLTDRTQGGTSYSTGEIELMVHRRLLTDDGFGLEEPLNEEAYGVGLVVKGKHRIFFGNFRQEVDDLSFNERVAALSRRWRNEPWVFLTSGDKVSRRRWQNVRNKRYSVLRLRGLPRHVHVLTLEPWKGGAVLLRLENTLEKVNRGTTKTDKPETPDDYIMKPSHITVSLRQLFLQHKIKTVRETTLAANQWLDDARQMDWSTRYVYTGADDDILAEDNVEYRDEAKVTKEDTNNAADTVSYDEEETRRKYKRNKQTKFGPPSKRFQYGDRKKQLDENGDRRKRSLNQSLLPFPPNINENIINGTFVDNIERDKNTNVTSTEIYVNESVTLRSEVMFGNVTNAAKFSLGLDMRSVTKPTPKKMRRTEPWQKPARFFANLQPANTSSEEITSDEDFSSNIKKRSSRKRSRVIQKSREPEAQIYATIGDDGITRSIFDMYYRPHTHSRRLTARIEYEGVPKGRRRKKKYRKFMANGDYVDSSMEKGRRRVQETERPDQSMSRRRVQKRRNRDRQRVRERVREGELVYGQEDRVDRQKNGKKNVGVDMPFFITNERSYRTKKRAQEESVELFPHSQEEPNYDTAPTMGQDQDQGPYEVEEEDDDDDDDTPDDYERGRGERHKRSPRDDGPMTENVSADQDQTDQSEFDYIITLRPTQIRTFVVWFEPSSSKGSFVM